MSGNPPPNRGYIHQIANMFDADQERLRLLRIHLRAPPFMQYRADLLFIIGFIATPPRNAIRMQVIEILENLFNMGANNPEQGELITVLRRTVVGVLRYFVNHPNHPRMQVVVQLLHNMIVRDHRLGFPIENPLLLRYTRILLRTLEEGAHMENAEVQDRVFGSLGIIFQLNINNIAQNYNPPEVRLRLQYTASLFEIFLNDALILGQGNRHAQTQFINYLFHMYMNIGNYTNEHFELLLLMGQLLVEPHGFGADLRGRLQELLNRLHQDAVGHAFIQNFENILMEIIAEEEHPIENQREPSTNSNESTKTFEKQLKGLDVFKTTAQSKRRRSYSPSSSSSSSSGGKKTKPAVKQAKPSKKK